MANETTTLGLLVQVGDGASPEVFTTIGGITALTGLGGGTTDDYDTTALEDTNKKSIKGLTDYGECSLNWNIQAGNALQQQLIDDGDSVANVDRNYQVLKVDASTVLCSFNGYAKPFTGDLSVASVQKGSQSIKLQTKVTWVI